MNQKNARSTPTDADLVRQSLTGEPGAFEALVKRHFGVVWTIAFARLREREAAEDLVQEVFVRVYLHLRSLRDPKRFVAWICRLTRNLATDWERRGQARSAIMPLIPLDESVERTTQSPDRDPRQAAASHEENSLVRTAIAKLPSEQREVVLLHFVEGLSLREIAGNLGVAPSTVTRQFAKATHQMRCALEPVMRDSVEPLRARAALGIRTVAVIAALAESNHVRAAVLSAVSETAPGAAGIAAKAGLVGFLKGLLGGLTALTDTGGTIVATHKTVAAVVAVAAIIGGASIYRGTQSPRGGEANASTASMRVERSEPVQLTFAPRPGETWTQTTQLRGHALERPSPSASLEYDVEMRVLSEARVSASGAAGEITVDHVILEAAIDVNAPHLRPPVLQEIQRAYQDRAVKLAQAEIRETLDAQGRRIRVHATMSPDNTMFGVPFEPMVLAILYTPTVSGDASLETGVPWNLTQPMPFIRDSSLTTTSMLDHVELIDEARVAVIRTQGEFHLDETARGGFQLGTHTEGDLSGRCLLHRLDFLWTQDSSHRLSDGHRLRATGRMIHDMAAEWIMTRPGGAEFHAPYALRIEYEFVTEAGRRP